jgi:hypothetical protein
MDRSAVQAWLDRYVDAWRANRREPIVDLFTEDAAYRYRPYGGDDHVVRGHDAIVETWLDENDAPDSWEAHYEPFALEGDRAVAVGTSRYIATDAQPGRVFHNCFLLRFAPDGRCAEFVEYYMEDPAPES